MAVLVAISTGPVRRKYQVSNLILLYHMSSMIFSNFLHSHGLTNFVQLIAVAGVSAPTSDYQASSKEWALYTTFLHVLPLPWLTCLYNSLMQLLYQHRHVDIKQVVCIGCCELHNSNFVSSPWLAILCGLLWWIDIFYITSMIVCITYHLSANAISSILLLFRKK